MPKDKKTTSEHILDGKKTASAKKTKAVKGKSKGKVGGSKRVKGKPGRKPSPKPPEPVMQKANIDDLVNGFLNELDRMGGLRMKYYLTVRVEK